jgi:hypothetical protein
MASSNSSSDEDVYGYPFGRERHVHCFFWDTERVMLVDIMPRGQTINSDLYVQSLKNLQFLGFTLVRRSIQIFHPRLHISAVRVYAICSTVAHIDLNRTSQVQSSQRKHQETFAETTVKTEVEQHHGLDLTAMQEVRTGRRKQTLDSRNRSCHTEASHRTHSDFISFYLLHRLFLSFRFIRCLHPDGLLLYNRYHCHLGAG